jgi:hypothetical protein
MNINHDTKRQAKLLLKNLLNGEKPKERTSAQANVMFAKAVVQALPLGYNKNLATFDIYIQSLKMRSVYEMNVIVKEFKEFCKRVETIIDEMRETECMN